MRRRVTLISSIRKSMSGWGDFYVARQEGNVFLRLLIGTWYSAVGEPVDPAEIEAEIEKARQLHAAERSGNPRRRSAAHRDHPGDASGSPRS